MSPEPPEVRPFRWIGAIAFFGVVSAALAVLALEAIDDSFTWIGDGRSQSDAVILATDPPPEPAAGEPADDEPDEPADDQPDGAADDEPDGAADDGAADGAATADEQDGDGQPPATYTVQPGDTGSSIAGELLGDQQAWQRIAELNDIPPGATLNVGDVLRIPES